MRRSRRAAPKKAGRSRKTVKKAIKGDIILHKPRISADRQYIREIGRCPKTVDAGSSIGGTIHQLGYVVMVADRAKADREVLLHYAGLQADIFRQKSIIQELERDGHPTVGARTLLRLLESDLDSIQRTLRNI